MPFSSFLNNDFLLTFNYCNVAASDESSNGLGHTCDPVDGKYAPNYMRDIEAKSYGKPVSQGSKSPEWMKKENQTMDYFSQVCALDLFVFLLSCYQHFIVHLSLEYEGLWCIDEYYTK